MLDYVTQQLSQVNKKKINTQKIHPFSVQKQPTEMYCKKVFSKIAQYSQEKHQFLKTLFLIKLQIFKPSCIFMWILRNFKEQIFWKNICERLLLKLVLYLKKRNCHFFHIKIQTDSEKNICQFLQSCFPLAEVTINFLVSWNHGFQNSLCSSKESIISRGTFATQIL